MASKRSTSGWVGQTLADRYRLGARLGRGAIGAVYDAYDERLGRRVAVKLLHPHLAVERVHLERFRREAEAASALNHPNIIKIFDFKESKNAPPFLVMEHLTGRDLDSLLKEMGSLPPSRVVLIGYHILSALEAAHTAGIIHRDLKPANVFLAEGERGDTVKLLDFGLVRLSESSAGMQLTRTGQALGTPGYAAPEQARGEKLGVPGDLFAVGVIMFQSLTGRLPFAGPNPAAQMRALLEEPPPDLLALVPGTTPALAAALNRALAKRPGERFQSARDMRLALAPWESPAPKERDLDGIPTTVGRRPAGLPPGGPEVLANNIQGPLPGTGSGTGFDESVVTEVNRESKAPFDLSIDEELATESMAVPEVLRNLASPEPDDTVPPRLGGPSSTLSSAKPQPDPRDLARAWEEVPTRVAHVGEAPLPTGPDHYSAVDDESAEDATAIDASPLMFAESRPEGQDQAEDDEEEVATQVLAGSAVPRGTFPSAGRGPLPEVHTPPFIPRALAAPLPPLPTEYRWDAKGALTVAAFGATTVAVVFALSLFLFAREGTGPALSHDEGAPIAPAPAGSADAGRTDEEDHESADARTPAAAASSAQAEADAARGGQRPTTDGGRDAGPELGPDGEDGGGAPEVDALPSEARAYEIDLPSVPRSVRRMSERKRGILARRARNRAHTLLARRSYRGAEAQYQQALVYEPESAATARGLARVYGRVDEQDKAVAWARRAVELSPDQGMGYVLLGDVLEKSGDLEAAGEAWRRARSLGVSNRSLRERLQRMPR